MNRSGHQELRLWGLRKAESAGKAFPVAPDLSPTGGCMGLTSVSGTPGIGSVGMAALEIDTKTKSNHFKQYFNT